MASWTIIRLVNILIPMPVASLWVDLAAGALLGAFLSGMAVAFSDKWTMGETVARPVFIAVLFGLVMGTVGALIGRNLPAGQGSGALLLNRVLTWALFGALIGLGIGLRWLAVNKIRVAHAFLGGFTGGALGGLSFAGLAGLVPDVSDSLGYMLLGVGICAGVVAAPVLAHAAILHFIRSDDSRALMKLGRRRQWELQEHDYYIIGSRPPKLSGSSYRPEVNVWLPDATVADQHAKVYSDQGNFYVARHESISGPGGDRYFLALNDRPVAGARALKDGDTITVGGTILRIEFRRGKRSGG